MKPKIIFKTTAGVFNTEPKWFLYMTPVEVIAHPCSMYHETCTGAALLGIRQPLPKRNERFNPSIPYVSCETD